MRNYLQLWCAAYTSRVIASPTTTFEELAFGRTAEEYQASYNNLLFVRLPGTWEFDHVDWLGAKDTAHGYMLLNKGTILSPLTSAGVDGKAVLRASVIHRESPRDTWSHGH